jgi:hypothetical protein
MKPRASIKTILQRARVVFLTLLIFFFLSLVSLCYVGIKTGEIKSRIIDPIKNSYNQLAKSLEEPIETPQKTATPSGGLFSEFEKATFAPALPTTQSQPKKTASDCYRYTVTHLDGSTSNLCYSQADYNQLVSLGYSLSSAKSFYQFHLEGAQKYQEQYDSTGSKIYLDAKASSERDAQREKDKIGQITLQMQEIEKRGY